MEESNLIEVESLVQATKQGKGKVCMNDDISDAEVKFTFGKGSDTPGPDDISSKLIDTADRSLMHECLKML